MWFVIACFHVCFIRVKVCETAGLKSWSYRVVTQILSRLNKGPRKPKKCENKAIKSSPREDLSVCRFLGRLLCVPIGWICWNIQSHGVFIKCTVRTMKAASRQIKLWTVDSVLIYRRCSLMHLFCSQVCKHCFLILSLALRNRTSGSRDSEYRHTRRFIDILYNIYQ